MKKLLAMMLLVTAMAVTGCGETKKPATTTPPTGGTAPPVTTPAPPADPAK